LCLALVLAAAPAAAQDAGEWPMPGRDCAGWRYSGLEEIDLGNVARLAVAWTFSTGVLRGQEAAPIVATGAMFVVTPYPNVLYALDLTREGAPLKWKHEPKPLAAVALLLVAGAGALAWRDWRRAGRDAAEDPARPAARARFLGLMGLLLCARGGRRLDLAVLVTDPFGSRQAALAMSVLAKSSPLKSRGSPVALASA
jgi:hypothetical protein